MKRRTLPYIVLLFAFILAFASCKSIFHVADISEDRYTVGPEKGMPEDQRLKQMIAPYKIQLDSIMDVQIGTNAKTMSKARPEGELNNWLADIVYTEAAKNYKGKIDFSIQNYGGIRVPSLEAGPITVRNAYEIMPFDNEIVVLTTKGIVVKALFERIAEKGGWPVSSQIKFVGHIDGEIISLKINGEDFDETKTYTYAIPDYIANGGDRCDFLKNVEQVKLDLKVRDAIIANLKSKPEGVVEFVERDGRIKIKR